MIEGETIWNLTFVRENHKPEGKLMGRAGNKEYCEKEEKEFSFYVRSRRKSPWQAPPNS